MRAAVYYRNDDVRVEDAALPVCGDGEALVKVEASGICGSDVMEWYRVKKAPLVLGHEIAGTIVEARGAALASFKPGDRVTAAHHVPCNTCRYCLKGEHSVCDTLRTTNFKPGGFAEYVLLPSINVERGTFRLPDGVSFVEGTFSEPLGCVVRGMRVAGMAPGRTVLVIGSGMSGLLFVKLAAALGASRIIATDVNDGRLDAARRFGADTAVNAASDVPALVRESLGGHGADIVVVCAAADQAISQGLKCVDRGGTVLLFAPKEPGATFPMPLFDLWRDNVRVVHSYASPPGDTLTAIDLIASGRVKVMDMVSHRLPLSRAGEGFRLAAAAKDSIKVVIEPHG